MCNMSGQQCFSEWHGVWYHIRNKLVIIGTLREMVEKQQEAVYAYSRSPSRQGL